MKTVKLKRIHPPPPKAFSIDEVAGGFFGVIVSQFVADYLLTPMEYIWDEIDTRLSIRKGDEVEVSLEKISVQEEGEEKIFRISEIMNIKVHFYGANPYEKNDEVYWNYISRIQFEQGEKRYRFYFKSRKKVVVNLCKEWYDHRVKFKEYYDGRRVFLGKQPTYNKVQEIKEQYGVDW